MNDVDCSLRAYATEFSKEFNQCLQKNSASIAHAGEAACITLAALEALRNMKINCSPKKGSLDCSPGGYVDAVIEGFDPSSKAIEIGFGKVKTVVDKALGGILPPPAEVIYVTVGGCAVGGVLGGLAGAAMTPTLPILGGGFGIVKGCEYGTKVGLGLYGLWKMSVKVGGVYEATGEAIQILGRRSQGCAVQSMPTVLSYPEVPRSPVSPVDKVSTLPSTLTKTQVIEKSPPVSTVPRISFPSSLPAIEPVPRTSAIAEPAPSFEWIDIQETAEKIVDIAADLTGVTSSIHQVKELKALFVNILSSPEKGPKLLVGQLIKEPEKILQRIVSSPKEFLNNSKTLLSDPTLSGVVSVVGTAFTIISVANEILPIATRIRQEAFKNPIALPATVTKELVKLTANKIVGVVKMAEGLLKDPIRTSTALVKGIVKSPQTLLKNVKSFMGLRKNKAKKKAKRQQRLQESAEKQIQANNEPTIREIVEVLPTCYSMAKKQWMISEELSAELYLAAIVDDWKRANATRMFRGSCGPFLRKIHFSLMRGDFAEVAALSPTAHSSQPIPPAAFFEALHQYRQSAWSLASEVKIWQHNLAELNLAVTQLSKSIEKTREEEQQLKVQLEIITKGPSLLDASAKLQNHLETLPQEIIQLQQKSSAVAARLRGNMTSEKAANLRAILPYSQNQ